MLTLLIKNEAFIEQSILPMDMPNIRVEKDGRLGASIPIALPPGNKVPQLSLVYTGMTGLLGDNWTITGIEFIARSNEGGIPFQDNAYYMSSMAGILASSDSTTYYPIQEAFMRFTKNSAGNWTAKDKQGTTYTFGKKITTQDRDGVFGNPTKLWVLSKVSEIIPANNYEITYTPDTDIEGYPYPDTIIYNNNSSTNRTEVKFEYVSNGHQLDLYTHGAYSRLNKKISSIKIYNKGELIDTYTLTYTGNTLQSLTREGYKPIHLNYTSREVKESNISPNLNQEFPNSNFSYYAKEETFASGFGERANCSVGENFCVQSAWPGMHPDIKNLFSIQCAIFFTKYKNMCGKGIERSIQYFADVFGDTNPEFIRVIGEQNNHKIKATNLADTNSTIESDIFQLSKQGSIIPADIDSNFKIDFFVLEGDEKNLKLGITKSDKIEIQESNVVLQSLKTTEDDNRSFHFVLDYNGDGLADFLQAEGTKDDRRWYDLSIKEASNQEQKQEHIDTFQNELILKNNKNGILAINKKTGNLTPVLTPDGNMLMLDGNWIVFGYNDKGEFKEKTLDTTQDINLIQELMKDESRRDKGKILSLSTSKIGHTANTDIDLDIKGISFYKASKDANGNFSFSKSHYLGVNNQLAGDYGVKFQQFKDMDNNGTPDFLRINGNNQLIITYFDSSWTPITTVTANIDDMGTDGNRFFADINGDGFDDFVVLSATMQGDTIQKTSLKYYFFNGRDNFHYIGENQVSNTHYTRQTEDEKEVHKTYEQQVLEAKFKEAYPIALAKFVYGDNPSPDQQAHLMNVKEMADTLLKDPKCDPYIYQCDESLMGKEGYEAWKHPKTFADINDDGKLDFVRYYNGKIHISFFNIEASDSNYYSETGDVSFEAEAFTQVIDTNGDGKLDFVGLKAEFEDYMVRESDTAFSYNVSGRSGDVTLVTYTTPGGNHNMLSSVSNGLQTSQIQYGSSITTDCHTEPCRSGMILPLKFPDVVVSSLTTVLGGGYQEVGKYEYFDKLYYNGGGDTSRSKLLGFQKVEKTKTLISPQETISSKDILHYNQYEKDTNGKIDVDKAGSVSKTEKSYPNKTDIFLETTFEYGKKTLYSGGVMVVNTKTTTKQLGEFPTTEVKTKSYDSYGNVTTETVETTGRKMTTTNTYEIDEANWILGRTKTTEKKINGAVVESKDITYTGNLVTQLAQLVAVKDGGKVWKTVRLSDHDAWGNPLTVTNSLGKSTSFTYDDFTHKLVTSQEVAGELIVEKTYDYKTGNVLTEKTKDGIVVNEYDFYGRLVKVKKPWHSGEDEWSEKYFYHQDSVGKTRVDKYVYNGEDEGIWIRQYKDVLGREYKKESKVFSTDGESVVTVEDTTFDIQGRVTKKTKPYLQGSSALRYTTFYYDDPLGRITKAINPNGNEVFTNYTQNGQTLTTQGKDENGASKTLNTIVVEKNPLTHTMTKTINGTKIQIVESLRSDGYRQVYTKSADGDEVSYELYDLVNNKVLHRDRNSGTTTWNYDQEGRLMSKTNANGKTIFYEYDAFDRVKKIKTPAEEGDIEIVYGGDDLAPKPTKIIVKDIHEVLGERELYVTYLYYDKYGRVDYAKKVVDELTLFFKYHYDATGRLVATTYPNGITVRNHYAESGHLYRVTMEKGNDVDNEVLRYGIDPVENILYRITGNQVKTTVQYDPFSHKPLHLVTKLANGTNAQNWVYKYDSRGNVTEWKDIISEGNSQFFDYDEKKNYIKSATGLYKDGKVATENYEYDTIGNLVKKGNQTRYYEDPNHPNAVTRMLVETDAAGITYYNNYAYDPAGNMTSRNDDLFHYNSRNQLIAYQKQGNEPMRYYYDEKGKRFKKTLETGEIVYTFDDEYEVVIIPGEVPRHTIYVKGVQNDLAAQYTTDGAVLMTESEAKDLSLSPTFWDYLDRYRIQFAKFLVLSEKENPFYLKLYAVYGASFLLFFGFFAYYILNLIYYDNLPKYLQNPFFREHKVLSLANPFVLLSILLVFGNCVPEGLKGHKDTPFWLLGTFSTPPSDADVPPISNPGNGGGGTSGSGRPIRGMYFLHPDHLGSVRMITDANGRIAAIGDAGASNIRYKPYGEVNRGNSYGPDIFRYKYTAQQEDIESGLYYYKSRYYDPNIGQFMQADSVIGLNTPLGTNQYAYTEGNPVRFTDPSGHMSYDSMMNRIYKDFVQAGIAEISSHSDLAAATLRLGMRNKAVKYEKKLNGQINFQLIKSVVKTVVGAVLLFTPGFQALGVSLFASGLAGLGAFANTMAKTSDRGKALRTSKLAESVVGLALFLYSFMDWGYDNLGYAVEHQEAIDAADAANNVKDAAGQTLYDKFWPLEKFEHVNDFFTFSEWGNSEFWTFYKNCAIASLGKQNLTFFDFDITEFLGAPALNFPGYVALALAPLDAYTITTYNHDVFWSKKGNPSYYYRESIRKGLYYTPYTMDFLESGGLNDLFSGGWGN